MNAANYVVQPFQETDFNFVAVPNVAKPAFVRASVDTTGYHVTIEPLQRAKSQGGGVVPRSVVIHFRANNKSELARKILAEFPTAVFTLTKRDSETVALRQEYQKARIAETEQKRAVKETEDLKRDIVREHREIAASMTPEEQNKFTNLSLTGLCTDPDSPWREFLHDRPNFLAWPNDSYANRNAILQYCQQKGYWPIPTLLELSEAMQYLLRFGHLHLQPSYKRSEVDKKNSVRRFEGIVTVENRVSQDALNIAVRKLRELNPFNPNIEVSIENLRKVGFDNAEEIFTALAEQQGIASEPNVDGKTSAELKKDLQAMRDTRRGTLLSRRDLSKGY